MSWWEILFVCYLWFLSLLLLNHHIILCILLYITEWKMWFTWAKALLIGVYTFADAERYVQACKFWFIHILYHTMEVESLCITEPKETQRCWSSYNITIGHPAAVSMDQWHFNLHWSWTFNNASQLWNVMDGTVSNNSDNPVESHWGVTPGIIK